MTNYIRIHGAKVGVRRGPQGMLRLQVIIMVHSQGAKGRRQPSTLAAGFCAGQKRARSLPRLACDMHGKFSKKKPTVCSVNCHCFPLTFCCFCIGVSTGLVRRVGKSVLTRACAQRAARSTMRAARCAQPHQPEMDIAIIIVVAIAMLKNES